jgi:RNA 2',3'-cyclic 3'-phosphodiesterase
MRAFVALEVPDQSVLDSLVAFQRQLAGSGADLKVVERENLHFTIKFLGEITEAQAKEADSRLRALSLSGGEVEIAGVGAFPSPGRPRVVWVGVAPRDEPLVGGIARAVIGAVTGLGEADDRTFTAHVTLARVRSAGNLKELSALIGSSATRSFGSVRVRALKLKSSTLTPRGPVYSDMGVYPLA